MNNLYVISNKKQWIGQFLLILYCLKYFLRGKIIDNIQVNQDHMKDSFQLSKFRIIFTFSESVHLIIFLTKTFLLFRSIFRTVLLVFGEIVTENLPLLVLRAPRLVDGAELPWLADGVENPRLVDGTEPPSSSLFWLELSTKKYKSNEIINAKSRFPVESQINGIEIKKCTKAP